MRTSISTSSAPDAPVQIHLKQGFQYHLRGTKYSIPDPKPGRAKGQQAGGSGLILREDQKEYQNAVKREEMRREREERKLRREVENGGGGRWNDPDVSCSAQSTSDAKLTFITVVA
jgi:RNA-binding protein NOB1